MKKLLIVLFAVSMLSSCAVSADRAVQAAQRAGLADVRDVGSSGIAQCSDSDMALGRLVSGVNAQGMRVQATVCCGVFKQCTVRF